MLEFHGGEGLVDVFDVYEGLAFGLLLPELLQIGEELAELEVVLSREIFP